MQKSVLVEIIHSLNKKEVREIHKWLQSPAHNLRQDVVALFDYLSGKSPEATDSLEKEVVWRAVFPQDDFDDARMRQVMYFLLKAIEDYLAFTELRKDEVHIQTVLLKVYRTRQLEKPFKMTLEAARKRQKESPYRNSVFLREQHVLEQELYYYLGSRKRSDEVNLQETSDALDLAYFADKLQIGCRMLAHQTVYKKAMYDLRQLENTLAYVEQQNLLKEPAIAVYYYGFKALTERENETHFANLERIIFENGSLFPMAELRELYLLAINYCISRINAGIESYLRKSFEFYKEGFSKGILIENNLVTRISFGNAVSNAIKIKEFAWVEEFIEKFTPYLEEKSRESTVHFNLARLYFEKKDYVKAQQLLLKFDYDDILLNLVAKTMLLKIYYEEEEYSAFESLLESMRTYLQRKDAVSANHRIVYKNLFTVMRRLIHLNPFSKTQKDKFRELVLNTNPLLEKEWLLNQLDRH